MILFILQKFYSAFELITKMINRHEDAERLDGSDENELPYLETSDFRPKESYIMLSQSVAFLFCFVFVWPVKPTTVICKP